MKILSLFIVANYGKTIVSAHQPAWFFQTYYQSNHQTYLDSSVAQRFIEKLTPDKSILLRNNDDYFYLKKCSSTDNRVIVFVTNHAIEDTDIENILFEKIRKSIGEVNELSGIIEKDESISALQKIIAHPIFTIKKQPPIEIPPPETKPQAKSCIFFYNTKNPPKFDQEYDIWLNRPNRGGLYESD